MGPGPSARDPFLFEAALFALLEAIAASGFSLGSGSLGEVLSLGLDPPQPCIAYQSSSCSP
jgi:hypothetical protein